MELRTRRVRGPALALANLLVPFLWVACDDGAVQQPDAMTEAQDDAAALAEEAQEGADAEEEGTEPDADEPDSSTPESDAAAPRPDAGRDAGEASSRDTGAPQEMDAAGPQQDGAPADIMPDAAAHEMDAGDTALGTNPDAATAADTGETDTGTSSDGGSAEAGCACAAPTAICLDGVCVECSAGNTTACAAYELCDEVHHVCVDNAPFQLDCAHLPSAGVCQGGPREVILGMHRGGLVAMFDPVDGHYLGWFSRRSIVPNGVAADYYLATQAPDQCIWTVRDNNNYTSTGYTSIDRLDTDGSFKDSIIPIGRHYVTDTSGVSREVINSVRSIAFTEDAVYVASTRGNPQPRVTRFKLDGELDEVVLDDGSVVDSLLVLRDGSMVIANRNGGRVEQLSPDRSERRLVASVARPGQLAYAGQGAILTVNLSSGGRAYRTELASGQSQEVLPWRYQRSAFDDELSGIGPLGNGQWIVSLRQFGVRSLDPASTAPSGQHSQLIPPDPSTADWTYFRHFGRACLSDAFVRSRDPALDPPLTNCAAPAGTPLFEADFETRLDGFAPHFGAAADPATIFSMTRENTAPDNWALKVVGGWMSTSQFLVTARVALPDLKPSFIAYSIRGLPTPYTGATVILNELDRYLAITGVPDSAGEEWVRIQLRDIDWVNRTYDVYMTRPGNDADCTRLKNDALFNRVEGETLKLLDFGTGWETAVGWIDDIVIK